MSKLGRTKLQHSITKHNGVYDYCSCYMGRRFGLFTYIWGPFQGRLFHRNSNSMEVSFCYHPHWRDTIAMTFNRYHDSRACAKFRSNIMPYDKVTLKPIFHFFWIKIEDFKPRSNKNLIMSLLLFVVRGFSLLTLYKTGLLLMNTKCTIRLCDM